MDLLSARRLANDLLEQHGLKDQGWRFAFDDSRSHFGCCSYRQKVIFLSRVFTLTITDEKVKDTILHEIAHSLCPGHYHDEVWKRVARSIGCRGDRCGDITKEAIDDVKLEKFRKATNNYSYTCPECNYINYHRKELRGAYCSKCYTNSRKIVLFKIKKL